jgi:ArsR family transcriptional regulator
MVESKKDLFNANEQELATFCKALSHPARIKILNILNQMNSCMVGDMVELLPLSQSTVSQHLKELKNAGLIVGEIEGPKRCYCLNAKVIERATNIINELLSKICQCK